MKSIYIYGASGHGLVVADIAISCGYENIIFIDDGDNEHLKFEKVKLKNNIPIAFGIGNNIVRAKLFEKVQNSGFKIISLIHPTSIISSSAKIENGTVVMPNVVINAKATIGQGVILNTGSIIEHECKIGDFAHISPNVSLAGNVIVDKFTHIGIGSCIIQGIKIGKKSLIGSGSVVVKDIKDNIKAYGNPCKVIGKINE
ncbi:acetyltransferase [Malaciobacter mytili]|uniref:acetyltransferase n=1 Tax=Malaciobacter mytili TaxID=603050 RepID=UPI00100BCF7D|nr:acetyltransferase [Malaciobacter mytili]RXI38894.1 acetyltransferase [Malaciobacter mytili]